MYLIITLSLCLFMPILCLLLMMKALVKSKTKANVTSTNTANIRMMAFLVSQLMAEKTQIAEAILSGCYVVGSPICDVYRWMRSIWFFSNFRIYGKAPDIISLTTDPYEFLFLGSDFMEQICNYLVLLLNGKIFMGETISANRLKNEYSINISWSENQIVIDLFQFKPEHCTDNSLNATLYDDALHRDLTYDSLYCPLGDAFIYVIPTASDNMLWFQFLLTLMSADLFGKILDPIGSGIFTLKNNIMDLCRVRDAYLNYACELGIRCLSEINDTGAIRVILVDLGIPESELHRIEDKALDVVFEGHNFITVYRLLCDLMKGVTMPPWLHRAMERWVIRFVNTEYSIDEIQSKASILEKKFPKLVPNMKGIPDWGNTLLQFFFNHFNHSISSNSQQQTIDKNTEVHYKDVILNMFLEAKMKRSVII